MKSASWAGSILLLVAVLLLYATRSSAAPDLDMFRFSRWPAGSLAVEAGALHQDSRFLDDFMDSVQVALTRDLGVPPGDVNRSGGMYSSTPFGAKMSTSVNCSVSEVDSELLETVLLGVAIDKLEWIDESRQVIVVYWVTDSTGAARSRRLEMADGVHRWVNGF